MGLSRNKVAVPEGAAGSPPFYGVFFQDAGLASVVWPMRREWFPEWCGRAGVEEIVGFAGSVGGLRAVVRICFWVPGPPPATWSRAVFRMSPWGGRPAGVPCPDRFLGAWWFENWIVDASNAMMIFCHRLLYRDFARLCFGVWFRDRSFCDHFLQCDDLSSGVEKLSLGFFGACAALKGVWWMPWQTVPMKDV